MDSEAQFKKIELTTFDQRKVDVIVRERSYEGSRRLGVELDGELEQQDLPSEYVEFGGLRRC